MNASVHAIQNHEADERAEVISPPCRLAEHVRAAMDEYFASLSGDDGGDIYALVMSEVERPLLACVLKHCGGNQTRAASLLGLNRATLRKKLRTHGLP